MYIFNYTLQDEDEDEEFAKTLGTPVRKDMYAF